MTWLRKLLEAMSPEIVKAFQQMIKEGLQALYVKALATENKWDDTGVELMAKIFNVELEVPEQPEE